MHAKIGLGIFVLLFFLAQKAEAHRDGCHRWHSCPSDTGSYTCGDLGYFTYCGNTEIGDGNAKPGKAKDNVHLWSNPSEKSKSLQVLRKETPLTVLLCDSAWCVVTAGDSVGFMMQKYIQFL
ncbi:MAG: hypothetical protein U0Z75_06805 [Deinococcaceae bacterium]